LRRIQRGDIYHVDLEPTQGHEQRGRRPVLIVSPTEFNQLNLPLIAPVTRGGATARLGLMAVPLTGAGTSTTGVILCNQLRTLDIVERRGSFIERLDAGIVRAVLIRIADIYEFSEF
jgi:mRNA interferase ChpB